MSFQIIDQVNSVCLPAHINSAKTARCCVTSMIGRLTVRTASRGEADGDGGRKLAGGAGGEERLRLRQ